MQKETLVEARKRQQAALGTSRALEKQYLRLTATPTTDTIRPPIVLERSLQLLKEKWLQVSAVDMIQLLSQPACSPDP